MKAFACIAMVAVALLFFNNEYSQERNYSKSDYYTGTYQLVSKYKSDMGKIEIEQIAPHQLKFYLNVVRTHYGYIAKTYGKFHISKGIGVFHNHKYGAKNCTLTFHFKEDTLYINQKGTNTDCRFGLNASVNGKYKKINSKKPLFKDLKREKAADKKSEQKSKQDQQKMEMIRRKYMRQPIKLIMASDIYNKFLYDSFRDSIRLMRLAGDLLHYRKQIKEDLILKCMQALTENKEFQSFPKHWIALTPTDTGYVLLYLNEDMNPSIEITDSAIIINEPKYTRGRYIKNFHKIGNSIYEFSCFGDQFIGPDTCKFKILNPKTKLSIVTYIQHIDSRKVSQWYMTPIENITKYPISTQRERQTTSVKN